MTDDYNYTTESYTTAVVTANYYGFGQDENEALSACCEAGGRRNVREFGYYVYELDRPCRLAVTMFGGLTWQTTDGTPGKAVDLKEHDRTT